MLQVTFGDVTFSAPETSRFLSIAIDLLNIHKESLTSGNKTKPVYDPASESEDGMISKDIKSQTDGEHSGERGVKPKGRWFVKYKPKISLPDGEFEIPDNLEQLKAFIASKGLTPHPRGDASMLLWQVRNRLKLQVEAIDWIREGND